MVIDSALRPAPQGSPEPTPTGTTPTGTAPATPRPTLQPLREPQSLSPRLRVRRAVYLVVLTLVVPGAAQLSAGSRRIGRVAVRVWLTLWAAFAVLALLWLLDRTLVYRLATTPALLGLVTVLLFVGGVAWPVLVVDAWRVGRPGLLPRRARLAMTGLMVVTVLATSLPLFAAGRRTWAAADLINGVFGSSRTSDAVDGRFNVLLLGGDAGPDRVGTRPDSMTLVSIDTTTGRAVLFSLPRNLENVKFAPGSPADNAMPAGWSCGDKCLLNGIYTWGQEHKSVFPGVADPGAEAMKEAVTGITGLTVNYYVLIDLLGFRRLIDAMGGIRVTVNQPVPIGGGTSKVSGYIQPGTQTLDGYHALWFARSRHGASDYARMERQRCVMDAMVHQLDPATVLRNFQGIAAASKDVMSTDVPAGQLAQFIDLATKAKSQKITSVQFVPPLVNPAYPDFALIRARTAAAITASQKPASEKAASDKATAAKATSTTPATARQAAAPSAAAGVPSPGASASVPVEPVDISSVCSPA